MLELMLESLKKHIHKNIMAATGSLYDNIFKRVLQVTRLTTSNISLIEERDCVMFSGLNFINVY